MSVMKNLPASWGRLAKAELGATALSYGLAAALVGALIIIAGPNSNANTLAAAASVDQTRSSDSRPSPGADAKIFKGGAGTGSGQNGHGAVAANGGAGSKGASGGLSLGGSHGGSGTALGGEGEKSPGPDDRLGAAATTVGADSGASAVPGAGKSGGPATAGGLTLVKMDGMAEHSSGLAADKAAVEGRGGAASAAGNYSRFLSVVSDKAKSPLGLIGLLAVSFCMGMMVWKIFQQLVMGVKRRIQVREWQAAKAEHPKVVDLSVFRSEKRVAA